MKTLDLCELEKVQGGASAPTDAQIGCGAFGLAAGLAAFACPVLAVCLIGGLTAYGCMMLSHH
jgi:hypothetical protein